MIFSFLTVPVIRILLWKANEMSYSARIFVCVLCLCVALLLCHYFDKDLANFVVPDVTSSTWQEQVLGSDLAVLVEFWAPWCGPCRMMHPVIGKLSKIYEGKLKCFKLNTDDNQEVATRYGIRSIPTIIIFKNGEKKDAIIGAVPESDLVTTIVKYIAN
jgi:thioredoxin 1